jgi:hypothetical protein
LRYARSVDSRHFYALQFSDQPTTAVTCLYVARSDDGARWQRPELIGCYPFTPSGQPSLAAYLQFSGNRHSLPVSEDLSYVRISPSWTFALAWPKNLFSPDSSPPWSRDPSKGVLLFTPYGQILTLDGAEVPSSVFELKDSVLLVFHPHRGNPDRFVEYRSKDGLVVLRREPFGNKALESALSSRETGLLDVSPDGRLFLFRTWVYPMYPFSPKHCFVYNHQTGELSNVPFTWGTLLFRAK